MFERSKIGAHDRASLALNVAGSIAFALAVNAVVFAFNWDSATKHASPLQPPGYVVGAVWVALFASMGYARYLVTRSTTPASKRNAGLIFALIVFCAIYPLYTIGLSNAAIGLGGSIATLGATLVIALGLLRDNRRAAAFLAPVAAWLCFASYLTAATLQS